MVGYGIQLKEVGLEQRSELGRAGVRTVVKNGIGMWVGEDLGLCLHLGHETGNFSPCIVLLPRFRKIVGEMG